MAGIHIDNTTVYRYNENEVRMMMLNQILSEKGISKYRLAKLTGIPQTTILDLCSGKSWIEKCNVITVYKIAKALGTTVEQLIMDAAVSQERRLSFSVFKSSVCHRVKDKGDIDFLIDVLESDEIEKLYEKKWYPESLYLLAMVDYLSRENHIPLCEKYDQLRTCRLSETLYPSGIVLKSASEKDNSYLAESLQKAIPEFLRHNIVENEVRDVC